MTHHIPVPSPVRRAVQLLGMTACVFVLGTLGFRWIEGQSWFDSFYMTLITMTTIGYSETIHLSQAGRYFNAALIIAGFGVVFVGISIVANEVINLELQNFFERRKTTRMIKGMTDHYIVCGLGRVGRAVIDQLRRSGARMVAVDSNPAQEAWARDHDVPLLIEDATLDVTLEHAGARQAKGLVAATSSDAVNVYITLSARVINPDLRIGARASDEEARKKLLQAGAVTVFTPYTFTGFRIAQSLLRPQLSRFLDIASAVEDAELDVNVDEYRVTGSSTCSGSTIGESQWIEASDVILLAIQKSGSAVQFNPPKETRIGDGDVLVVIGRRTALERMKRELGA